MSGRYLLGFTFLLLSTVCLADVQIACSTNTVCAGDFIFCNCTSNSSDADSLRWSIRNLAGMEVGSSGWLNLANNNSSYQLNNTNFTFAYIADTIGYAAFRASPGISNYSLVCSITDDNDTTIDRQFPPFDIRTVMPLPNDFMFKFENFTGFSVTANWTDPDDFCLAGYLVNVTINGSSPMLEFIDDSAFVITNTNSTVDYGFTLIPGGLNGPRYDLAFGPRFIRLDTPVAVTNLKATYPGFAANTPDGTPINVTIMWNPGQSNPMRPETRYYNVTHNATRHLETTSIGSGSGSGAMSDDTFTPSVFVTNTTMDNFWRLRGAVIGETYLVSVIPINPLGKGTAANLTFTVTYMPPQPTSTSSVMSATSSTTATPEPSTSPTPTEESDALPTWAIAVIAVGGGLLLALVIAIIIVAICCCACRAAAKKEEEHEMHGTKL